jgi:ribosomal protein L34
MQNHRKSYAKRARKCGFLARQRTSKGRLTLSNKRRVGRSTNVRKTFE